MTHGRKTAVHTGQSAKSQADKQTDGPETEEAKQERRGAVGRGEVRGRGGGRQGGRERRIEGEREVGEEGRREREEREREREREKERGGGWGVEEEKGKKDRDRTRSQKP